MLPVFPWPPPLGVEPGHRLPQLPDRPEISGAARQLVGVANGCAVIQNTMVDEPRERGMDAMGLQFYAVHGAISSSLLALQDLDDRCPLFDLLFKYIRQWGGGQFFQPIADDLGRQ
jgi:hypothetical protein